MRQILLFLIISFSSNNAFSADRFEYGSRGYLMDSCQEALDMKNTFKAGYCSGIYTTVLESRLLILGTAGISYCPDKDQNRTISLGIIIKWIKEHPKQWNTQQSYYAMELALKEAYPCD